jgi:hypothetical protein
MERRRDASIIYADLHVHIRIGIFEQLNFDLVFFALKIDLIYLYF